jgi:hypothetical protein
MRMHALGLHVSTPLRWDELTCRPSLLPAVSNGFAAVWGQAITRQPLAHILHNSHTAL